MEITEELLAAGASARGGFSKQQLALLGIEWPPSRGWKQAIVGRSIPEDDVEEFLRIAGRHLVRKAEKSVQPINWCGSPEPIDIYLYVLALTDGCFYVGLTSDVANRMAQHFAGEGAEWTKLHAPVKVLHTIGTGTKDGRAAEQMEDEVTITLMLRYGIDKVRGGHFSYPDQTLVETNLRGKGYWERIKQAELGCQAFDTEASWADALDRFIELAVAYYDAGAPVDQHDAIFAACYRLTRYHYWHEDFAPGLSWHFWNRKGILPVLLSFKFGRPVGSRLASAYDVLAAALNRGRDGAHPLRRLFLLAWQAYAPPTTGNQAMSVARFMEYLSEETVAECRYDAFVSVLLPEMRYLLRQK
ncbi:GIY-YIG nuclease family protein [Azonexus sp. R2A61]|uniref:GIY-YIG nuclease family protein n=1 Tax=Azonexus sp. R2A61 TaxID=2744443 RepID=UPI001F3EAED7|nr:GIY-YIG nuclease family protein [Azonexus sp. R2A61]